MGRNLVFDIMWTVGALLLLVTAWAIITGRHDRYYRQFRNQGIPPDARPDRRKIKSKKR